MRRLALALLAVSVLSAVVTAPARATTCGGKPALKPGCCCKSKAPAPPKAPCCQVAPTTSDAALLAGVTVVPPAALALFVALVPEAPRALASVPSEAAIAASPPGSPPVFLLDCTFRI